MDGVYYVPILSSIMQQEQDPKGIVGLKRIIMKQGKENEFESLFMDLMTRVRKHEKEVQLCSLQIRTI